MPLRLALRPPPFFTTLVTGGLVGIWALGFGQVSEGQQLRSIVVLGLTALVLAVRWVLRPRSVPDLELHEQRMRLPRGPGSRRVAEVDYRQVRSVHLLEGGGQGRLVIGTRDRHFVYPLESLERPELASQVRPFIQQRLRSMPGGAEVLQRMAAREALARVALSGGAPVTFAMVALNVLAYVVLRQWEGSTSPLDLGGNAPVLVADGQWWRLATATFLHSNRFFGMHLIANGVGLLSLGGLLERLVGSARLLIVYLLAALGGAAASAFVSPAPLSIGSSTAVFGLLGCLAWLHVRFGGLLPGGFHQSTRWWVVILGLNASLPILLPIDSAAHVGGFLAGALATVLLCRSPLDLDRRRPAPRSQRVVARLLVVGFVAAAAQVATRSDAQRAVDRQRMWEGMLARAVEANDAARLNELAWVVATDEDSGSEALSVALDAAERAHAERPREPHIRDTLATVLYRLGRLPDAIAHERMTLPAGVGDYGAQLARFLAVHTAGAGPLRLAELAWPVVHTRGAQVRVRFDGSGSAVAFVVAHAGERVAGVARVRFGAGKPGREVAFVPPASFGSQPLRWQLALVDDDDCTACIKMAAGSARLWPMLPHVERLP